MRLRKSSLPHPQSFYYRTAMKLYQPKHQHRLYLYSKGERCVSCFLSLFVCCLLFFSCSKINVFEKNISIPNYQWHSGFSAKGSFAIADTLSTYNMYVVLRHTDAYKYNNIWLSVAIQPPEDSMHLQKINLLLGNDASGWEGTGMNDIWEVRKLLNEKPQHFKNPGTYNFSIYQIMRDDPLPNIMSVGMRVEKR